VRHAVKWLQVCPVSVLSNWESQLQEHTNNELSLCVYYGTDRAPHRAALATHDMVLTTYGIMVADKAVLTKVCLLAQHNHATDTVRSVLRSERQFRRTSRSVQCY
jgi:SNF2-related domain